MKNILIIDSADHKVTKIELISDLKKDLLISDSRKIKSQTCLNLIFEILQKNNISLEELTEIKVNTGPGSFTGLRVGISIANTFGTFLNIPINGKKVGELEQPVYN
jgi:tRNA threonylcarbamoyladenosine biosynthesis protein TsaB